VTGVQTCALPICPTTLTTTSGDSYQWYLNGEAINGATSQSLDTVLSGTYTVSIDLGSCNTTASIDLVSQGFESSINVEELNIMEQGDMLYVEVTTTSVNPEFQWYFNDVLIPDVIDIPMMRLNMVLIK